MTAQEIREKIAGNRQAWYQTTDPQKRKALHEATVELYGTLDGLTGTTSTFNSRNGVWTTTAPGAGNYQGQTLPEAEDLSEEVTRRQNAATRRAEARLGRAKAESEAALDRQERAIGAGYQAARNQTAAQSEVEKMNLGRWAADSGLNSGAAGQVALSQSVAAQSALGALTGQEQAAYDEVDAARQEMERDYAYAVAEARTEGDYALAQALYDEAKRVDEARRDRALDQAEQDRAVYELARENRQWDREMALERDRDAYEQALDAREWAFKERQAAYEQAQDDRAWTFKEQEAAYERDRDQAEDLWRMAQERGKYGDFQGYARLGYSQGEIQRMTQLWRLYQMMK